MMYWHVTGCSNAYSLISGILQESWYKVMEQQMDHQYSVEYKVDMYSSN